ncbi:hypothetical protein [Halobacillus yeomjeoni]|uniref:Uncharacterized protein n=1 Tax=Halobacillus yeomjeoni TaxID=311194 RepID=A0A931HSR8_9BACI|nr:hypothetical protein [Halobacillus yeomjeoni]MBH0228596.1 hypothetical protein [Halobacillus yeomjeoni]
MKMIGFTILGAFTLNFGTNPPIPIGFIVYLLFFSITKNKAAKKGAVYLGLFLFILASGIPFAQKFLYEFPRHLEVVQEYGDFDFADHWGRMQDRFDLRNAELHRLRLTYDKEGEVSEFDYYFKVRETNDRRVDYRVELSLEDHHFTVNRRIHHTQQTYNFIHHQNRNEHMEIGRFFNQLEEVGLKEIQPDNEYHFYKIDVGGEYYRFAGNVRRAYYIRNKDVHPLKEEDLTVYGVGMSVTGFDRTEGDYIKSRALYFMDAALNVDEEEG